MEVLNPNKLPTAPITEFKATQGELKFLSKENYYKLKTNIEKHGFDVPVTVWIDDDGQKWLLDGHQRKRVLENEGWNEPIPYLELKAPDKDTAAERLLAITSQFGTITQEGLDEFIATFELPEHELADLTSFDGIFDFSIEPDTQDEEDPNFEPEEAREDNRLDKLNEIQCPECGHHDTPASFAEYNDEVVDSTV